MTSSQTEVRLGEQETAAKLLQAVQGVEKYLWMSYEKLSNMELRQSNVAGQANDALRAVQQWAQGQSSSLTRQAIEQVHGMLQGNESPTYYQAWMDKDLRRAEYVLYKFYEICIKQNDFAAKDSQEATGECFLKMPAVRQRIESVKGSQVQLPEIPPSLKELYKLIKPMNRAFLPMGVEKMKEFKILPKYYDGFKDITDEEAKTIWNKLAEEHQMIKTVEEIPLNEQQYKKCTWHERLLLKIHEYNKHSKKVALAEATIARDEDYQQDVTAEQFKKASEEHDKKLDKFWSKTDPAGAFAIEKSAGIKRKWAGEATENSDEQ